jgi:hypothetical protein
MQSRLVVAVHILQQPIRLLMVRILHFLRSHQRVVAVVAHQIRTQLTPMVQREDLAVVAVLK